MVLAAPLQPGETYASVAQIRDVADLPELPVIITEWGTDAQPCKILLRALSYAERRDIRADAKADESRTTLLICQVGIKSPTFTRDQLTVLESKHPGAIDAIALKITELGEYDAATIIAYVAQLAGVADAADDDDRTPSRD